MESNIIGRTIDSYQILDVLGRGGMGVVYRARDLMLDKDVAVKMMDARLDPEGRLLKRFQEEARSLGRLQHPNIVGVYTLRESQLGLCIVMEFVKGKNLSDIIKENGGLPLGRFKKIFLQCLNALEHAHTEGIIHRDIKPSNIMLTEQDVAKITDFGLAKRLEPSPNASTVLAGGTLYYSPPEQLDSLANVDFRGDIYSLGMTMYEALTGKIPFADTASDFRIRQAIVEGHIPPPDKLRPDLPDDVVRLVMKAIHKEPEKRFRSAAAMAEALENCAITTTPRRRKKAAFPVKGLAIGLFTMALALLGYLVVPKFFASSPVSPARNLILYVRDQSGAPVPNAAVLIGPARDLPEESIELSDLHSNQFQVGQLYTSTDISGATRLAYRAKPETRVRIVAEADSFSQQEQTAVLPQDSLVIVMARVTAPATPHENKATAVIPPPTVFLHDRGGNPVPQAIVTMLGRSGKEYSARTDLRGKAVLEDYALATEGESPSIRVAINQFKTVLRSKPRPTRMQTGAETALDINDFVPYDQTLSDLRGSVTNLYDEVQAAKDRISGTDEEKGADPDYRQALDLEKRGQRQFDQNDFENARGSLQQARTLYVRAAERLTARTSLANATPPVKKAEKNNPDRSEPARTDIPRKEIAPPDVHRFVEKYKSGFEKEDLAGLATLLRFSQNEQSTWSKLFNIAENLRVTTDSGKVENDTENAHMEFGYTISYDDKASGEPKQLEGILSIGLHYSNGKWEVVSHQFMNK
jgi:serine/threonine protein kinase